MVEHVAGGDRRQGTGPVVISLAGRSWKVVEVDWRRRVATVVPAEGGGRSRWLGAGRALTLATCQAAERIVAGTEPGCRLSRRAVSALAEIRSRLAFVDGQSLPVVSDGEGRVTLWAFAGGAASASVARELAMAGMPVTGFDDVSVTLRTDAAMEVVRRLAAIDPLTAHPRLPAEVATALKFGLCLPQEIAERVLVDRSADPKAVAALRSRPPRLVTDLQ